MTGLSGLVMQGCGIFAQNKTDYDTTTAIHTFKSALTRLGRGPGSFTSRSYNERWAEAYDRASATRMVKPTASGAAGSSSASSSTGVPTGRVEHLAVSPPCETWPAVTALGSLPEGRARHPRNRPARRRHFVRRRHFYERLGSSPTPTNTSTVVRKPFTPHRLVLMSYPAPSPTKKPAIWTSFGRAVLRYSEHEAPALKLP